MNNTLDLTNRPAYSREAEQVIVGSCIQTPALIGQVRDILKPGDYYEPRHEVIWDHLHAMVVDGKPIQPMSLIRELEKSGELDRVGGREYIVELYGHASAASATYFADEIREDAVRRSAQTIHQKGARILDLGTGVDTKQAIADQIAELQSLLDTVENRRGVTFSESMDALADLANSTQARVTLTGIPDLDKRLGGGFTAGQFVLIGALTGVGKTHLGIHLTNACAITAAQTRPVAFFSLEMEHEQVTKRLMANIKAPGKYRLESQRIATPDMTEEEWDIYDVIEQTYKDAPIHIFDKPAQTLTQIRTEAERVKKQHGDLGLIVIDYVQLMGFDKSTGDRRVDLEETSRRLKSLAKELDCTVVAMMQLNADSTKRADGRPSEHDAREAKGLSMDADVVLLLDREDKRNPNSDRLGEADIIGAKVRGMSEFILTTSFAPQHSLFTGQSHREEPAGGWDPLTEPRMVKDYATGERVPARN